MAITADWGKKPKKPKEPPGAITPAYVNEAGKPIIRNGCNWCGLLDGRHTATCPMGARQ